MGWYVLAPFLTSATKRLCLHIEVDQSFQNTIKTTSYLKIAWWWCVYIYYVMSIDFSGYLISGLTNELFYSSIA